MFIIFAIFSGLTLAANNYGSDLAWQQNTIPQSKTPYRDEVARDKAALQTARNNGDTNEINRLQNEINAGNRVVRANQETTRDRAAFNNAVVNNDYAGAAKYQNELRTDSQNKNNAVDKYQRATEGKDYTAKEIARDRVARDNARASGNYINADKYQNQINNGKATLQNQNNNGRPYNSNNNNYGSDAPGQRNTIPQSRTPYRDEVARDKTALQTARNNGDTKEINRLQNEINAGNTVVRANQETTRDRAAFKSAVANNDYAGAAKYQKELRTDNQNKNKAVDKYQKVTEGKNYNKNEVKRDTTARNNARSNGNYVAAQNYQKQIDNGKKNRQ
jgi:hypothetical protein